MVHLIIGTPGSGKSELAEAIVSADCGDKTKYYIAAMIPYGQEGSDRVAKHRRMRQGKGFITLEIPFDIDTAPVTGNSIALLECVSNLVANELFERHTPAGRCEEKIISEIGRLAASVDDTVIVSNHFEISDDFDDETRDYSLLMDRINERLRALADEVTDLTQER